MPFDLSKEIAIRIEDPRIILNEFFGYLSFISGLITAAFLLSNNQNLYNLSNQILLGSCALQNVPLLLVYIPQWRVLLTTGILGIIVTNYFATNPIGNAFREGIFVAFIKIDYSYEALNKYHSEIYPDEQQLLGNKKSLSEFTKALSNYLRITIREVISRSIKMLQILLKGNFKALIHDAIHAQFFSSLLRVIFASPLILIAFCKLLELCNLISPSEGLNTFEHYGEMISVRTLAFASFLDGLSKIAFGYMRNSFMMKLGGTIFALAQMYLMFKGAISLNIVIPLSLAGLAAYPIVEGERLRKIALINIRSSNS